MKEVENQIEQLNQYFKNKILNGDYNFIKATKHIAEIIIDDRYTFIFWIANGFNAFKEYSIDRKGIIYLIFDSEKDKENAYAKVMIEVNKYRKTYLKAEKIKDIEKLQKEIKEIDNKT